jgi:hypothetical protein
MTLKENLNKIHFSLSNRFDVELNEKNDLKFGNYIEFSIKEDIKELKAFIRKSDLENSTFSWNYLSNPLDIDSTIVERSSNIDGFLNDVVDIFEKNRFDSDYLEKIK